MTREELIEAVIPALGLSYVRHPGYAQGRARRVIDAVEPLIRADEREFLAPEVPMARDDLRNELRAKVEALPGSPNSALDWVLRVDVLALLDGDTND